MKLKLALALPSGALHDVTISCDVTTTVRDTAAALIRTGLYRDSNIEAFHALRHGHVTIIGSPDGTSENLLELGRPTRAIRLAVWVANSGRGGVRPQPAPHDSRGRRR